MRSWHLIYIASNSHSGSTLLDALIGSHTQRLTLGDIHKLKSEGVCASGAENHRDCPF